MLTKKISRAEKKGAGAAANTIEAKATRGRKSVGSQREAQKKWVAGQKKKGRVQLSTWVPSDRRDGIKEFIDQLKKGKKPGRAFAAAFPQNMGTVAKLYEKKASTD